MAIIENYKDRLLQAYPFPRVDDTIEFGEPGIPIGLTVANVPSEGADGNIINTATVSWTPQGAVARGYTLAWKVVGQAYAYLDVSEIFVAVPTWLVGKDIVCKVKARGVTSDSDYSDELEFNTDLITALPEPPLNLRVIGGPDDSTWADDRLSIGWDYNPANDLIYLKDYVVSVFETGTTTLIKEYILPFEADSDATNYKGGAAIYPKEVILNDFDHPERSFKVSIQTRDKIYRLSTAIELEISNPAPDAPLGTVTTFENDVVTTLDSGSIIPDISSLITAVSLTSRFDHLDRTFWLAKVPAQRAVLGVKYPNVPVGTLYARFALDDTYSDLDLNWSEEITVNVTGEKDYLTPDVPTGLYAVEESIVDDNGVEVIIFRVYWDAVSSEITSYTLSVNYLGDTPIQHFAASTATELLFYNVKKTTYEFQIRADNNTAHSEYSTPLQTITAVGDTIPPGDPENLFGYSTVAPGSVALAWDIPDDVDYNHTQIFWSTTNSRLLTPNVSSTDGQRIIYNLLPGTEYFFWVRAVDNAGNPSSYHPLGATAGVSVTTVA